MFKKIMCAALASLMFVPALVSCANNDEEEKPEETGSVTVEIGDEAPTFEEDSFGGEDFTFLIYGSTATDFVDAYIWSDGVTGGTIPDAVMDRNRLVEEKYEVKITAEEHGSPMGEAKKRMQSGQCDFEIIYEWGIRSKSAAMDGLLYNFHDLSYVDFDQSYWVEGAAEGLTVADKLFVNTNYITMNPLSWAGILFFNKMILDKLQYDEPYNYVYANQWTYDVLLSMIAGADEDLDGDGEITAEDQWGMFGEWGFPASGTGSTTGFNIGNVCNEPLFVENDDGSYTLKGYTESMLANYQTYESRFNMVTKLGLNEIWATGKDTSGFSSIHVAGRFLGFGEDHCLFMGGSIDMTKEFVNMKSDYGLVPIPTVNPGDEFSAGVDYCAPMFSIPMQVEDPDMVGIILEYMAYESEKILLPAYYETTVKTKRMEDVRDYDMLDIVRNNIDYNWFGIYMWDSDIATMRDQMIASGHFASVWKRYESKGQAELDEFIEKMTAIEN